MSWNPRTATLRRVRRAASVAVAAFLSPLLAAGPAAAEVCTDVTKTRTVTYTVDEPYEIRGDVLVPNYDWVWEKTGTERLYGITGYKTETTTTDVMAEVWPVDNHLNTFVRTFTTSYKADGKTWYVTNTRYVDWKSWYKMDGTTRVDLGAGPGKVSPFSCSGTWYRIKGTSTWVDDNEPTCGNHGATTWGGYTWDWDSHVNDYASKTKTMKVGETTTTTKVAQYDWYDSDTYDWVWDIVSYSPENQVIESGTRQVTKERTETYTERQCVPDPTTTTTVVRPS